MKRKAEEYPSTSPLHKKPHLEGGPTSSIQTAFRKDLFTDQTLNDFRDAYRTSRPYPHAVVSSLISEALLRAVREEIKTHIHFTLKETDIYRIHQSGDLANLSNLDADSLKHLPNLLKLRDALYSEGFREWISSITGAGKVSGQKTDMAVNVYTPGSYLLCHDDVIGSRRVSYILYLTDPDKPWKKAWGGGLRLYPTESRRNENGEEVKVPRAEHTVNIPPAFSQMSFFAVRPGESYHDVEEVYPATTQDSEDDGGRIRMAISGWYHIPQEGEAGYEKGVEETMAQKSSLAQLKGKADEFDEPRTVFTHYDESRMVWNSKATRRELDPGDATDHRDDVLTEQDLTFLLHYITPSYLTPDLIEQVATSFEEESFLQLDTFFCERFAEELKTFIMHAESREMKPGFSTARPPHKHRYEYMHASERQHGDRNPIPRILTDLLHSHAFKKWLSLTTGFKAKDLVRQNVLARRFRRGKDYALASSYTGEQPQLEFTIGMTPSAGWEKQEHEHGQSNGDETNGTSTTVTADVQVDLSSAPDVGGEEVYMAGDDEDDKVSTNSKTLPSVGKKAVHDPAVYKANEDEDDGILFTNTPSWNTFSAVLRDQGTLRFVKYVSQAAKGDRWDVKGEVELGPDAFADEDEENNGDVEAEGNGQEEDKADEEEEEDVAHDSQDYDSDPAHYEENNEFWKQLDEVTGSESDEDEGDE